MNAIVPHWWHEASGECLAQGDLMVDCMIPRFGDRFGVLGASEQVPLDKGDLIIVTQSCDLENRKAPHVAMCPIVSLAEFERVNPRYAEKGKWEPVRVGREPALHLLASPTEPANNREALVVDFRQIYSLPVGYLQRHAKTQGKRWRLASPFLEHFSQAFARFFMRVGLPSSIPRFT